MNTNRTVTIMMEIAVFTAFAIVLDFLAVWIWKPIFVNGGSISFAMVPILVISFRRGWVAGVTTGFLVGTIQLMYGGYLLHPLQVLFDYTIAYALVGFSGVSIYLFKKKVTTSALIIGTVFAGLLRYFSHYLSGIIFWYMSVPDSFGPFKHFTANTWSIFYNGLYMIPSIIICAITVVVLKRYITTIYLSE